MATHIRCYAKDCGVFIPIKDPACPVCGAPRRTKNGYLETAKLNRNLYDQAEAAVREQKIENHVMRGGQAPVTQAHRDMAAKLMEHL